MKKSSKFNIILFSALILIVCISIVLFLKLDQTQKSFELTSTAMGTYVKQTVYGDDGEKITEESMAKIKELENLISWRIDDSEISLINRNADLNWVDVSDDTLEILLHSKDVAKKSRGAFDPTMLPLTLLWGFDGNNPKVPNQEEIDSTLKLIDYKGLKIDEEMKRVRLLKPLSGLDLGGVGKGAACDAAVKNYQKMDAECGIVSVGGSIGVYGKRKNRSEWNIAIRDPFKNSKDNVSFAVLKINKGFVSTSGAYEKKFESGGKVYHHILNPKTGYPIENNLVSVSVYHENGIITDALSTACYSLGIERSQTLLEKYRASAIFVDKDKKVYITKDLKDSFVITDSEYKVCNF